MTKIFLSVPILGNPTLPMMYSMYQAVLSSPHTVRMYYNSNDSLISRVRNAHISVFLNEFPECEYFMSLDSDIETMNVYPYNNLFTKLIGHDLDFVGGLYAIKQEGEHKCSSVLLNANEKIDFDTGLKEVRWLSSGCWCLKRSVVEKMVKAYPELTYDGDDNMSGKKIHGLYIPMLYDMKPPEFNIPRVFRKYLSEDWSFVQRWRDLGGRVFADTSIVLNHIGIKSYKVWNVQPTIQAKPVEPPRPGHNIENKGEEK